MKFVVIPFMPVLQNYQYSYHIFVPVMCQALYGTLLSLQGKGIIQYMTT